MLYINLNGIVYYIDLNGNKAQNLDDLDSTRIGLTCFALSNMSLSKYKKCMTLTRYTILSVTTLDWIGLSPNVRRTLPNLESLSHHLLRFVEFVSLVAPIR